VLYDWTMVEAVHSMDWYGSDGLRTGGLGLGKCLVGQQARVRK